MSNVVVVAGGQWQAPIIQYLKAKEHKVYVVNPHVTETTELADVHIQHDITNVHKVAESLYGVPLLLITSDQSDVAVVPVAILSELLGTRGNSVYSVLKFTNKLFMARSGLTPPIGNPAVVKPVDANASRGFSRIRPGDDFESKVAYAKSYSRVGKVVVQQYVDGDGIILDGICSGGQHKTLAHAGKEHFREGVISAVNYPSKIDPHLLAKITKANDRYVEKSGLRFGITHAEYIIRGDDFYLLEIAARGGGFAISSAIVPWVTGINLYDILYDDLLGTETDVKSLRPLDRKARIQFYEFRDGPVADVKVPENVPWVYDLRVAVRPGDVLCPAIDGGGRHAFAIILAETDQQVKSALSEIEKGLTVR